VLVSTAGKIYQELIEGAAEIAAVRNFLCEEDQGKDLKEIDIERLEAAAALITKKLKDVQAAKRRRKKKSA